MYKEKAAFFDKHADSEWAAKDYGAQEREQINRLLALLPPLEELAVLEPGCGTGRLTRVLAEAVGPDGSVTAVDISERMAGYAQDRTEGLDNTSVLVGNFESLDLPRAGFDAVVCHQVFPHFNDLALALERMAGMLKPKGWLTVSHFVPRSRINDMHSKAGTAVEHDLIPDEPEMRRLFEEAGFEILTLDDNDQDYLLSARLTG